MAFECPRCHRVSHHPEDERHGYCAACHEFTAPMKGDMRGPGDTHIIVDGIVAARNHEPYVRLIVNGEKAQLTVAEATKVARDLLQMAARTEADAIILRFFIHKGYPEGTGAAIMHQFREFRLAQDEKAVQQTVVDPDSSETIRREEKPNG